MSVKILLFLNKFFKLPLHPFNMQNDGIKKYSMWQYEKGIETIKNYLEFCSIDEMFKNKDILELTKKVYVEENMSYTKQAPKKRIAKVTVFLNDSFIKSLREFRLI